MHGIRAIGFSLATVAACSSDRPPPMIALPPPVADEPPAPSASALIAAAPMPSASAAPPGTSSRIVEAKRDAAWGACHDTFDGKGSPEAWVAALASGCATATGMKKWGDTIVAESPVGLGTPASYPLRAKAGRCYRVFARGDRGVKDLDVAVLDSTGAVAAEDSTDSPTVVLLADGAVCFKVDDAATLAVRVESGKGKYAIQIWSDE